MHDKSKIIYIDGIVQSRGIIIFTIEDGVRKYLLIKSKVGDHWTFAKGHWLIGETELDAARREVLEETGIKDVEIIPDFLISIRYQAYGEDKIVKFYLGKVNDEKVQIDNVEVCEARWLPFAEAYDLVTHDRTKTVLLGAEEFLKNRK